MDTSIPHPQRFQYFKLLKDGKSFTIKNCKYIFKIDEFGGWKDQYGHYYNAKGQPDFQPQGAELTPSQGSVESDYVQNQYDEFQPEYNDQEHEEEYIPYDMRVSKNMQTLSTYPHGKNLRVYFSNISSKYSPLQIYEIYSKKVNGIKNVIMNKDNGGEEEGEGYFVMEDVKNAEGLVKLEGEKIGEREIYFEVEKLNELIVDPITKEECKSCFQLGEGKRKQINHQEVIGKVLPVQHAKSNVKQQQKQKLNQKQQQQQQQQKQSIQVNEQNKQPQPNSNQISPIPKVLQPQTFTRYTFSHQAFESPKKFYEWLQSYGYKKNTQIRNMMKTQNNGIKKITIQINNSIISHINNKQYCGKIVYFIPD